MRIAIEGFDLPGGRFCDRDGVPFDGVHVGVQVGREPCDLVSADAVSARWKLDVDVVTGNDGGLDFRGPAVHGKRGDRFLYLTWGRVEDGKFEMFRRAKLVLNAIDPQVVGAAVSRGRSLVGTLRLTDERGGPRCARVDAQISFGPSTDIVGASLTCARQPAVGMGPADGGRGAPTQRAEGGEGPAVWGTLGSWAFTGSVSSLGS